MREVQGASPDAGGYGDDVRKVARIFAQRGYTAAWVRQGAQGDPAEELFWLDVADEMDALEAADAARKRLRLIRSPGIWPRHSGYRM